MALFQRITCSRHHSQDHLPYSAGAIQNAFVRWMQATSERTDGELIAIDGKTLRSSYDRDSRQSTIHMVSAFAAQNRLVLGQVKRMPSPTKLPPFRNYSQYSM